MLSYCNVAFVIPTHRFSSLGQGPSSCDVAVVPRVIPNGGPYVLLCYCQSSLWGRPRQLAPMAVGLRSLSGVTDRLYDLGHVALLWKGDCMSQALDQCVKKELSIILAFALKPLLGWGKDGQR